MELKLPATAGYYLGWVGHNNLGDEVMFEAVSKCLSIEKWPITWLPFYNQTPGKEQQGLRNSNPRYTLCGLQGGGTLINRNPGCYVRYQNLCKSIVGAAPTFGTGVAHPEFWTGRQDWKDTRKHWVNALSLLNVVGVRGPVSKDLLNEMGLTNVRVVGDPALAFSQYKDPERLDTGKILINIGGSYNNMWGSEDKIIPTTIELVRKLLHRGYEVDLVSVWPEDTPMARDVACKFGSVKVFVPKTAAEFISCVEDYDVLVGLKLHAQILATCANVPVVFLEYRPKCRDFAESIGYKTIRTSEYTVECVFDEVERLVDNLEEERLTLASRVGELQQLFYKYCNTEVLPELNRIAKNSLWI